MDNSVREFIILYEKDVLRFCFYLTRHEAIATDLAQETFLKALTQSFQNVKSPKAYLFQISKNLFIDFKRRKKYEQKLIESNQFQATSVSEAELEVWQVLVSLDPVEQEVLLLVDREGLSANEAAKITGLSESALKSRLFRARENYQKKWNS